MELTDKVAIITGGKRIGQVVAQELAGAAPTWCCPIADRATRRCRRPPRSRRSGAARRGRGRCVAARGLRAPSSTHAVETFGRLDILVIWPRFTGRRRSTRSPSGLGRRSGRQPRAGLSLRARRGTAHARSGGGRIVNFADWLARSGRPRYRGSSSYYVAKAGVIALTEALALELAQRSDPRQRHRARTDRAAARPEPGRRSTTWRRRHRWAAGAAKSRSRRRCAAVETDFITGETIRVDGGRHLA